MLNLIEQCLADDGQAWGELWQMYNHVAAEPVRRRLAQAGFDASEADDVAVEIFGSLLEDNCRRLRSFQGTTDAELSSWLVHLAINFTRNWIDAGWRAKRREESAIEACAGHDSDGPTEEQIKSLFSDLESVLSHDDMDLLRSRVESETEPAEPSPEVAKPASEPAEPSPESAKPESERTLRRRLQDLVRIVTEYLKDR